MTTFHSDFWVAVAAAAPVIALSYLLTVGTYGSAVIAARDERAMRAGRRWLVIPFLLSPYVFGVGGFVLCWLSFADALEALADERDRGAVTAAGTEIGWAFFLLFVTACASMAVRHEFAHRGVDASPYISGSG